MPTFCSIIQGTCKQAECILWITDCSLRLPRANSALGDVPSGPDELGDSYLNLPDEAILSDVVSFVKDHVDDYEHTYEFQRAFWAEKGFATRQVPKAQLKKARIVDARATKVIAACLKECALEEVKTVVSFDNLCKRAAAEIDLSTTAIAYVVSRCGGELRAEVARRWCPWSPECERYFEKTIRAVTERLESETLVAREKQHSVEKAELDRNVEPPVPIMTETTSLVRLM